MACPPSFCQVSGSRQTASLLVVAVLVCLVASCHHQCLFASAKKDKAKGKGKGGNMVIMMGGGQGGGYGGGGYGGGGYGGGVAMPYPMPMPMFCPPTYGGGGRKGASGKGGSVKEKIVIIPVPAQMLSVSPSKGRGDEGYGRGGEKTIVMMSDYGGGGSYGGGGGQHQSDGYGDRGAGARSYGAAAASQVYAVELSPVERPLQLNSPHIGYAIEHDQYASASSQQAALTPVAVEKKAHEPDYSTTFSASSPSSAHPFQDIHTDGGDPKPTGSLEFVLPSEKRRRRRRRK